MSPEGLQEIQNQIEKNIRCDIFYSLWLWAELDIQEASNSNWHLQREKTVGKIIVIFRLLLTLFFVAPLPSPYLTLEKY